MYQRNFSSWSKHWDFFLLDILSIVAALFAAYAIRKPHPSPMLENAIYMDLLFSFVIADLLIIILFGTMDGVLKRGFLQEVFHTTRNALILFAFESLYIFGIRMGIQYSRLTVALAGTLYIVFSYISRIFYKKYFIHHVVPRRGRSLLIIADSCALEELRQQLSSNSYAAFRLAGICILDPENIGSGYDDLPILRNMGDPVEWVRLNWVDEILMLSPMREQLTQYANSFMSMGITVHISIKPLKETLPRGVQHMATVCGNDVISVYWNSANFLQLGFKRAFDIVGSIFGCLITGILVLFIGPAIYRASPGPIFYTQDRIGKNGRIFKMYKFRSMYLDADERKKEFMAQNRVSDGLMFKLTWDPRIIGNKELPDGTRKTGIGEFIRKTSLDEFPQFINVLKGDMSLVGTRPPTKDEWLLYKDHHRARMAMRPGITGMWQVSGRSNITDFEEVVKLDTQYIAEWSPVLDLKILFKTVLVVLKHEGSM